MGTYTARVDWHRQDGDDFTRGRYRRGHEWIFDGGARVRGAPSPHAVRPPYGDPAGVDPEEALIAALSSCHMLFFLHLASQRGFAVASYVDDASAAMHTEADGREWLATITLKPHVVFDGTSRPSQSDVDALHHEAHQKCYIANTLRSEVVIEGTGEGIA